MAVSACWLTRSCRSANLKWRRSTATRQSGIKVFVGTGYFDRVATTIASGNLSTRATPGSTEEAQFEDPYDHEVPDGQPASA